MEDYETDKEKLIAAVLQNMRVLVPVPDLEAVRIAWDEKNQCVKQEIIPFTDIYLKPTNNTAENKE